MKLTNIFNLYKESQTWFEKDRAMTVGKLLLTQDEFLRLKQIIREENEKRRNDNLAYRARFEGKIIKPVKKEKTDTKRVFEAAIS